MTADGHGREGRMHIPISLIKGVCETASNRPIAKTEIEHTHSFHEIFMFRHARRTHIDEYVQDSRSIHKLVTHLHRCPCLFVVATYPHSSTVVEQKCGLFPFALLAFAICQFNLINNTHAF